jgi:hypothetical protein
MGLFHDNCKECEAEVQWLKLLVQTQAQTILNLSKGTPHKVNLVLINKLNNQRIMATATLASNQKISAILSLVDVNTNLPVTGSFSGTTASVDNPAIGTATVNPDQSITFVALTAGTCNMTVNTNAAYTDSTNTPQTVPLTVAVSVTVTAVIVADQVALVITFSTPVAQ